MFLYQYKLGLSFSPKRVPCIVWLPQLLCLLKLQSAVYCKTSPLPQHLLVGHPHLAEVDILRAGRNKLLDLSTVGVNDLNIYPA